MAEVPFSFNFQLDNDGDTKTSAASHPGTKFSATGFSSIPKSIPASRPIPILPQHKEAVQHIQDAGTYSICNSSTKLTYVSGLQANNVAKLMNSYEGNNGLEWKSSVLSLSESQHSDLIPGVYEGGLKVWECSLDLVQFLSERDVDFTGMRILELGCGTGLPGIFSLLKGAACVHFQDYNPEVLQYITIPNVLLNTKSEKWDEVTEKTKFFSGDWSTIPSVLEKYDVILTSETIYSLESQPKLLFTLKKLCRPGTGLVYVAAKMFYFGVGGGVKNFCRLLKQDGLFSATQCKKVETSIPRVILVLTQDLRA